MDILRIIRNSTPEQCKEMGETISELGGKPRTADWYAKIDTAIAMQPQSEEQASLKRIYDRLALKQPALDALHADGLSHSQLLKEELQRRGDDRDIYAYLSEVTGECGVTPHSDVEFALQKAIDEYREHDFI